MGIEKIQKFLEKNGEPRYRVNQIKKSVYQDNVLEFEKITAIPKNLRNTLSKNFKILSFEEWDVAHAPHNPSAKRREDVNLSLAMRGTIKAILRLNDGNKIETVLLPNENGWTACISSQAGCALGCKFCATGKMGFKRNLTSEEITDQILYWKGFLQIEGDPAILRDRLRKKTLTNIVYMGMGEPFLNWKNTKKSLEDLTNKTMFGYGSRSISVSTVGIPDGIIHFAEKFPQMNLAVSLHSANDKKRTELMPINKKHSLHDLKNAIASYFKITNRKIFIEYLMLDGINNSIHDAEELKKFISSLGKKNLLHVNLIEYNEIENNFNPSPKIKIKKFEEYLLENNIHATIRKSLGKEIKGACGQLSVG